jgi:hypothetical protein
VLLRNLMADKLQGFCADRQFSAIVGYSERHASKYFALNYIVHY